VPLPIDIECESNSSPLTRGSYFGTSGIYKLRMPPLQSRGVSLCTSHPSGPIDTHTTELTLSQDFGSLNELLKKSIVTGIVRGEFFKPAMVTQADQGVVRFRFGCVRRRALMSTLNTPWIARRITSLAKRWAITLRSFLLPACERTQTGHKK
jgi:hypothetical protein